MYKNHVISYVKIMSGPHTDFKEKKSAISDTPTHVSATFDCTPSLVLVESDVKSVPAS